MSGTPLDRDQILADLADMLFVDGADLTDDANLIDLGLDSIRVTALVERWRARGAHVRFADLAEATTVGALLGVLAPTADAER